MSVPTLQCVCLIKFRTKYGAFLGDQVLWTWSFFVKSCRNDQKVAEILSPVVGVAETLQVLQKITVKVRLVQHSCICCDNR